MNYGTIPGGSGHRVITAFFDSRTDADEAVARLSAEGISRDRVRVVAGQEGASIASSSEESKGFWESLGDLFLPDEDRYTYAEGLRRGGYLVTVHALDVEYDRALDILDDEGTIDVEERAASWRSEGWSGYSEGTGELPGTASSGTSVPAGPMGSQSTVRGSSGATTSPRTGEEGSDVIQMAEEHLHVGKRDVSHGRVRVRSYVVEKPVQEQVTLRQENVSVERRPADGSSLRAGAVSGDELFRERTIEMEETREEAVVSKEARVTEELVVRKAVDERTETVSDTVRKTEVEVEDDRTRTTRDISPKQGSR